MFKLKCGQLLITPHVKLIGSCFAKEKLVSYCLTYFQAASEYHTVLKKILVVSRMRTGAELALELNFQYLMAVDGSRVRDTVIFQL